MKYRLKKIKFNLGLLMPIYVILWPLLSMFVHVDAWTYYIDTNLIVIDLRLLFYASALGACIFKLVFGNLKKTQIFLILILLIFVFLYFLSFLINLNSIKADYKQFINGFLLFSILASYTILYFDLINWNLVARLYALSLLLISIFGIYAFSRFANFGIDIISSSLSEQLFRLAGGKAFWVPSVLVLAFIFLSLRINV